MLHLHGPQTLLGLAGEHPQQRSEGVRRGFVGAGDGVEGDREGRAQWADCGAVRVGAEGGEGIDQRQAGPSLHQGAGGRRSARRSSPAAVAPRR